MVCHEVCLRLFAKQAVNQKQTQTDKKIVQITSVQLIITQQLIKLILRPT